MRCAPKLSGLLVLVCSCAVDMFHVVLLLLMQPYDNVMVSGLNWCCRRSSLRSSCIFLSTGTQESGEKHQAASCALQLLLKKTLLLTLMVSGRILNTACDCLQLCSRHCCIADADAAICKCDGVRLNVCCSWSPLSSSIHTYLWSG